MKKVLIIALVAVALVSCGRGKKANAEKMEQAKQEVTAEIHNAMNSLDYAGTYHGTVPAADGEGIITELTINMDKTYKLVTEYIGKGKDNIFTNEGKWKWDDAGNVIILENVEGGPTHYKVEEMKVRQLDMSGNMIAGDLAEKYILVKK